MQMMRLGFFLTKNNELETEHQVLSMFSLIVQIIRTQRNIAEPDPAVLRTALQNIEEENPAAATTSRPRARARDNRRFNRGNLFGGRRSSWGWRRNMDFMMPSAEYQDGDEDDYYDSDVSDNGTPDCVIA